MYAKIVTNKISRKIGKGRCKPKPSPVNMIPDVPHFEKDVVEWMTTENKLQVMVYILYYKII